MRFQTVRLFCLCCILSISACYTVSAAILDPGFGNDGRVAVELGVYGDRANAVAVQTDGRIVVAGSSSNASNLDFLLFRLLDDGSLDPDFNYDGTVTTAVGSGDDEVLALALQNDGKIIAAGYSSNGTDRDFALARYNSDGSLDLNFGLEGLVVTSVGNSDDEITGIVLKEDGTIIITGSALGTAGRVIVLGRYFSDGTLDPDFADDGFSFTGVGEDTQAESIALLDDQQILVSGTYSEGDKTGMMIVGFTADGQLDTGFGENGIAIAADGETQSEGYGLALRNNGKILVAGAVGPEGKRDAALFQFLASGAPDTEFEDNGVLVTAVSAEDDVLYDVVVSGDLVAASGYTIVGSSRNFLFITYEKSGVTVQQASVTTGTNRLSNGPSWLQVSDLQVQDSFAAYSNDTTGDNVVVDVLTTEFSDGADIATALDVVSASSIVAVGLSTNRDVTSAAVTRYQMAQIMGDPADLSQGISSILTGEPYKVTRVSAVIPVEILSSIFDDIDDSSGDNGDTASSDQTVTKRGIVFSTEPNPIYGGSDGGDGGDGGDTTGAPTRSNLQPAGTVDTTSVTLSLTTNVNSQCRYTSTTSGMAYSLMKNEFNSDAQGTGHTASRSNLNAGESYTYYVKCKNLTSGAVNTTDAEIKFTVNTTTSTGSTFDGALHTIGDLFVSTAIAADTNNSSDSSSNNTTSSSSIFNPNAEHFVEKGTTENGSGIGAFSAKLEKLKPGTFFYARAYAEVNGKTYYGNNVGFRTSDSCFVATAAFGSIIHPSVRILRTFRDSYLLTSGPGRALVTLYYRYSPPLADCIAADSTLRQVARVLLLPLVGIAWLTLQLGALKGVLLLSAVGAFFVCTLRSRRRSIEPV